MKDSFCREGRREKEDRVRNGGGWEGKGEGEVEWYVEKEVVEDGKELVKENEIKAKGMKIKERMKEGNVETD